MEIAGRGLGRGLGPRRTTDAVEYVLLRASGDFLMAEDIRVKVGFPGHVKTKYLVKLGGREAAWCLLCLLCYAGENKPHGDLSGMADGMIESAADWDGGPGEFIDMLVKCGFLDGEPNSRKLHDWDLHQPFAIGEQDRKDQAQLAGLISRYGASKGRKIFRNRKRTAGRLTVDNESTASPKQLDSESTPFPSPLPSPSPIPYQQIVAAYNATMTGIAKVREITEYRKKLIRKAWAAAKDRQRVEFWVAYFEECQADNFLNGTGPYTNGHENWRPDFDHLLKEKTIVKTYERALDRIERSQPGVQH